MDSMYFMYCIYGEFVIFLYFFACVRAYYRNVNMNDDGSFYEQNIKCDRAANKRHWHPRPLERELATKMDDKVHGNKQMNKAR